MTKTTTKSIDEAALVQMLHSRDEAVVAILYEKYSLALYGIIYRLLHDKALAEEQLQECFMKIWKYGKSYDPEKGRLFTWMMRIARNAAYDASRKKSFKAQQKIQDLDNSVSIIDKSQYFEIKTDDIGIKEMIEKLNTKYAQIIDTIYFRGYTQEEASERLDIPLGTIKTRTRKALSILRNYLNH